MKNKRKIILLTCAMTATVTTVSPPASASISPGAVGSLGGLWDFVTQVQSWVDSLKAMVKMKNDLFGQVNFQDLGGSLAKAMADAGLPVGEAYNLYTDIKGLLGEYANFQSQIADLRKKLANAGNDMLAGFLSETRDMAAEKRMNMQGTLGLAPDLAVQRLQAFNSLAITQEVDKGEQVQAQADATKAIEDIKKTVEETSERATETSANAIELTQEAMGIQSTREGIQMLVRAQAESLMSSAYNATAITTALSQNAMQQQVTNKLMNQLVKDNIDERVGEAYAVIQGIKSKQAEAKSAESQVTSVLLAASRGMEQAFNVDDETPTGVMFE
ncbi:hypothetical protein [Deinococcus ficus]|uniref:Uncharacterized protein n=1 Tax=Deinococcus ficus TaxID=317577 RepID=A0A221T367_9DEIO|nr:hypothetical protein [Deinococcus ficus]ASN83286.1 hypothetical protein DFI_18990 [Deinococcus ficus]